MGAGYRSSDCQCHRLCKNAQSPRVTPQRQVQLMEDHQLAAVPAVQLSFPAQARIAPMSCCVPKMVRSLLKL